MKQKHQNKIVNSQKGFTLLEILVVLTIMGFLIAMVAPRLAGISGDAVDTVCDTNQNRMVTYMSSFFEKTNRFPNNLTNLVVVDTTNGYLIPTISNDDPDDGAETLASEFQSRSQLTIHILDADEAAELKNMGIVSIYNLNSYDNSSVAAADQNPAMEAVEPAAGVGVAMVGFGHDGTNWALSNATSEREMGEPDHFGRIILGMGAESSLITSGVISNAAHCPGGIQNADNVTYNDYNLVLPRLSATVTRFDTDSDGDIDATDTAALGFGANADLEIEAVSYEEGELGSAAYDISTNTNNLRARTFNIGEAQEAWQYATLCPEGHQYPEDDGEFWGFDIDGDGLVDP